MDGNDVHGDTSMDQASAIQEFIHEVDAEYEEETDNDMAELDMSFTGNKFKISLVLKNFKTLMFFFFCFSESTIDDQTMDKDPADFIAEEEKFNFVEGKFSIIIIVKKLIFIFWKLRG
jgi:hypothetical protein